MKGLQQVTIAGGFLNENSSIRHGLRQGGFALGTQNTGSKYCSTLLGSVYSKVPGHAN